MRTSSLLLVLAAFLAVACASSSSEKLYRTQFLAWMHRFNKAYSSEEFQQRYQTFKANMDFVSAWDEKAKGFSVELNMFADMTSQEFANTYNGIKINADTHKRSLEQHVIDATTAPAAASVDWRTKGYVTGVKDQGQCGSCWSFSTTGSTEGAHFKKTNSLVSLSEQNLIDCSTSFGNQGCNGGLMDDAFQYIIKKGIVSEASYPYTAADGTCDLTGKKTVATLTTYKDITKGSETSLTSAISTVGPISVAIDASHSSFQLYKSGVYYEAACSATQLDHGVLAVGYGSEGSSDYYIVKNSWGTSWGMAGYINMARNKNNNCGIATMASYPTA